MDNQKYQELEQQRTDQALAAINKVAMGYLYHLYRSVGTDIKEQEFERRAGFLFYFFGDAGDPDVGLAFNYENFVKEAIFHDGFDQRREAFIVANKQIEEIFEEFGIDDTRTQALIRRNFLFHDLSDDALEMRGDALHLPSIDSLREILENTREKLQNHFDKLMQLNSSLRPKTDFGELDTDELEKEKNRFVGEHLSSIFMISPSPAKIEGHIDVSLKKHKQLFTQGAKKVTEQVKTLETDPRLGTELADVFARNFQLTWFRSRIWSAQEHLESTLEVFSKGIYPDLREKHLTVEDLAVAINGRINEILINEKFDDVLARNAKILKSIKPRVFPWQKSYVPPEPPAKRVKVQKAARSQPALQSPEQVLKPFWDLVAAAETVIASFKARTEEEQQITGRIDAEIAEKDKAISESLEVIELARETLEGVRDNFNSSVQFLSGKPHGAKDLKEGIYDKIPEDPQQPPVTDSSNAEAVLAAMIDNVREHLQTAAPKIEALEVEGSEDLQAQFATIQKEFTQRLDDLRDLLEANGALADKRDSLVSYATDLKVVEEEILEIERHVDGMIGLAGNWGWQPT